MHDQRTTPRAWSGSQREAGQPTAPEMALDTYVQTAHSHPESDKSRNGRPALTYGHGCKPDSLPDSPLQLPRALGVSSQRSRSVRAHKERRRWPHVVFVLASSRVGPSAQARVGHGAPGCTSSQSQDGSRSLPSPLLLCPEAVSKRLRGLCTTLGSLDGKENRPITM